MKPPKRVFLYYIDDPCSFIEQVSQLLLNTFILSHGIRVDTVLYIVSRDKSYLLNGFKLRHLYPQESSLKGFAKSIFCKNKEFPGVYMDVGLRIRGKAAVIYPLEEGLSIKDRPINWFKYVIVVLNCREYLNDLLLESIVEIPILVPRNISIGSTVTIINYILDTWYGAIVRRKGKIIVYRTRQ